MKKTLLLLLICCAGITLHAQKKPKGKSNTLITDYDSLSVAPVINKTSKKDDKKSKKGKTNAKIISENYIPDVVMPVADSSKRFTGIIKYRISSDDPADQDSVFVVFGENRFRVTMFIPGFRADQIFEKNMIANLGDSSFLELDVIKKTFKAEKLGARNAGTEFSLIPDKKTGRVMNYTCDEYKGEMILKEGEVFEAACLTSKQHSYIYAMDFNFMNIQPLVIGYKIVLGFRTKTEDNENTYIMAYKIEPGNTDAYFDLSGYKAL